jgi:hypothetical protein
MYLVRVNTERFSSERKEEKKNDDGGGDGRSGGPRGRNSSAEARVLSSFLNEMDGVDVAASASTVCWVQLAVDGLSYRRRTTIICQIEPDTIKRHSADERGIL